LKASCSAALGDLPALRHLRSLKIRTLVALATSGASALVLMTVGLVHSGTVASIFVPGSDFSSQDCRLPVEVQPLAGPGYDGQFFLALAFDPFPPSDFECALDDARYRGRRILWPLLAHAVAFSDPHGIVLALILLQLAFVGAGTWALARWATEHGAPPAWGLAFATSLGTTICLYRMLGDAILAALMLMVALFASKPRRAAQATALVLFAFALLQKETAVLALPLVAAPLLSAFPEISWKRRFSDLFLIALALAPAVAWWTWVASLTPATELETATINLDLPFSGWITAMSSRLEVAESVLHFLKDASLLGFHLIAVLVALVVGVRELPRLPPGRGARGVPLTLLGFGILGTLLSANVWIEPWAYGRALLPMVVLLLAHSLDSETVVRSSFAARSGRAIAVAASLAGIAFTTLNLTLGQP